MKKVILFLLLIGFLAPISVFAQESYIQGAVNPKMHGFCAYFYDGECDPSNVSIEQRDAVFAFQMSGIPINHQLVNAKMKIRIIKEQLKKLIELKAKAELYEYGITE